MLNLTRKVDESIQIGPEIRVTVLEIRHGKVRLGIEAPREIPVHRSEIWAAIYGPAKPGPAKPDPKT